LRAILAHVGLVLGGSVAGVVALEAALQGAARIARAMAEPKLEAFSDGERILCIGDSNVYGLFVERDESWPQVLERRWNASRGERRIEVVNLGLPAMDSSRLRSALPDMLESVRPSRVLVMVGVNDWWTVEVPISESSDATILDRLRRGSRVWGLLSMLWRTRAALPPRVTVAPGDVLWRTGQGRIEMGDRVLEFSWAPERDREWQARLARHLTAVLDGIRASGAEPILVTYPADRWGYAAANIRLRAISESTDTRLIDVGRKFHAHCPTVPCPLLLPDMHPSAAGHAVVAELLVDALGEP
jgi:lysophospholipase L1-like esterase